jgi:hypothetical protein
LSASTWSNIFLALRVELLAARQGQAVAGFGIDAVGAGPGRFLGMRRGGDEEKGSKSETEWCAHIHFPPIV